MRGRAFALALAALLAAAGASGQDLTVSLTPSPAGAVSDGDTITYTVGVDLAAGITFDGGSLSFPVPTNTTFESATAPAGCTEPTDAAPTLTCSGLAFAADTAFTLTVAVAPTTCAATIAASVSLSGTCTDTTAMPDPTTSGCSDSAAASNDLTLTAVDLNLTVTPVQATVDVGAAPTFRVTVRNNGASATSGAQLEATLPPELTYRSAASSTAACAENPGGGDGGEDLVLCLMDPLAAGAFTTVFLQFNAADSGDPVELAVTAAAVDGTPDLECNPADNAASGSITVNPKADLEIVSAVAAPNPAFAGEELTYTLTLLNNGPGSTASGTLTVELPDGAAFDSGSGDGVACTAAGTSPETVTCTLPDLASTDTTTVEVVTLSPPSATGAVSATATVAHDNNDPDPSNDSVTLGADLSGLVDGSITLTADPASPVAGGTVTFTLTAANAGPSTLPTPRVVLTPPSQITVGADVTVVSTLRAWGPWLESLASDVVFGDGFEGGDLTAWSAVVPTPAAPSDPPDPPAPTDAADAPPECVASGGVVTCDLADLEPGASVTFSLDGVISGSASGSLTTTASISGTGTESDPTNDEATLTFSVARRLIDLSIALTANPDPVPAGTTLQYDATVTNSGQAEATNAVIDLYLPLDTTLQTSLVSPSGTCSGDQPLTCTLGTLAASGGSASVTLQVLVAADAEPFLTLNALATADQVDADTGNDEASVDVEVN